VEFLGLHGCRPDERKQQQESEKECVGSSCHLALVTAQVKQLLKGASTSLFPSVSF
jgi:hypothetical protein